MLLWWTKWQTESGRQYRCWRMRKNQQDRLLYYFDTLIHDFGTIIEGEQVVCYFDYRNEGGEDLLISSVEATCGCTTPDWSREPLGPGEKGSLAIIFDASGRSGIQRKAGYGQIQCQYTGGSPDHTCQCKYVMFN